MQFGKMLMNLEMRRQALAHSELGSRVTCQTLRPSDVSILQSRQYGKHAQGLTQQHRPKQLRIYLKRVAVHRVSMDQPLEFSIW